MIIGRGGVEALFRSAGNNGGRNVRKAREGKRNQYGGRGKKSGNLVMIIQLNTR